MEDFILERLENRFDSEYLQKRMDLEKKHTLLQFKQDEGFKFYWENFDSLMSLLQILLRLTRLNRRGLMNTLDFQINHRKVHMDNLPEAFDGFTILQLSDLHIDGVLDHGRRLARLIKGLKYDMCVITGDFRFLTYGPILESMTYTRNLLKSIPEGREVVGILGNHDTIEMVPELEALGVRMLINESFVIQRGDDSIGIAGVDDPHFFATDDLKKSLQGIENLPYKILLAHSQELIPEAADSALDYYLCGHTHGGQICLPGGRALIRNTKHPFHKGGYFAGSWVYKNMQGYTSRGAGSSGQAVRFNCRPEITLHTLTRDLN